MGELPTKVEVALTRQAYLVGSQTWPLQGGGEQNSYYDWMLPSPPRLELLWMQYVGRDVHRAWGEVLVAVRFPRPQSCAWMWVLWVLG
jgi:hypothetical protein